MTLRNFWLLLTRWRWIVIPGVLLALGGGTVAAFLSPVSYRVESSYIFLSPVLAGDGKPGNPFLQLGNGVAMTVDIVAVSLSDGVTREQFEDDALDQTYTAGRDTSLSAPLMVISVEGTSLSEAYATLDALGSELLTRLDELQAEAGAPTGQLVSASQLTRDPEPAVVLAVPLRNGVSVAAGVLLLTLTITVLADRWRSRRRRRATDDPARNVTPPREAAPVRAEEAASDSEERELVSSRSSET